jgi:NIMA (never in mitosis gene a)-related kinase
MLMQTVNDLVEEEMSSEEDETSTTSAEEIHSATSVPLVVLSSRFKHASSLSSITNPGVAMVYYKYESTSLEALLDRIRKELDGRKAMAIAFLMYGQPGYVKINKQKSVTVQKLKEDEELREFFAKLIESHLEVGSPFSRVDLLQSSLVQNDEGVKALQELKNVMKVPVHASVDILGGYVSDPTSTSSIRIGTLFFDREKLNDWMMQTDKEARALYEKMWVEGTGAHGRAIVYRKKDDNSFVILKEINMMDLSKQQRIRALNEVEILARLNHPNIISYYDSFEEDGSLMIEMEYAERGTLAKYLSVLDRPMSEQEMLTMFAQMVEAIDYLHKERILHRDLKTANIFLTKEGMVKLGDFGISKILSTSDQNAETVLGTPYYISPEICENRPYNTKSDIWSLGCILYEMACGKRTFEGTNLGALVNKIVMGVFDPISSQYSKGFRDLVTDMLKVDPGDRPSAEDLLVHRLPPLMVQFMEEEFALAEDTGDRGIANTRSFLYHLDQTRRQLVPVNIHTKTKLEQVSIGFGHILMRTADHSVLSWGKNVHGQLGHGDTTPRATPTAIEALKNKKISKIECGGEFSVFVSDNGILLTSGRGDRGALGHGDWDDISTPKLLKFFISKNILNIACGEAHVVAMTTENELFSWGAGGSGRLGNGDEDNCHTPHPIPLTEPIESVECGFDGTMFLTTSGTLLACGSNQYNKLGLNERVSLRMQLKKLLGNVETEVSHKLLPTAIKELKKHRVVSMALGPTHSAVLVSSGCVYAFGRNVEGQLGTGNLATSSVATVLQEKPFMILCSELSTVAVSENRSDINRSFIMWGSPNLIETPVTSLLTNQTSSNGNHDNTEAPPPETKETILAKPWKLLAGVNDPPPGLSRIVPTQLPTYQDTAVSPVGPITAQAYLQDLLSQLPLASKEPRERERGKKSKKTSNNAAPVENGSSVDSSQQMIGFLDSDGRPCDLSQLGWKNIRLSHLSSYGPNLLLLLEADVPESPDQSTVGELRGASFKVNPELRRVSRWASGYFSMTRSRCSTPQPKQVDKEEIIVSMNNYLDGSTTQESMMRTWLKDVMADAKAIDNSSPLASNVSHDKPVLPLGLPAIVPQASVPTTHQPPSSTPLQNHFPLSKHKETLHSPRSPRKRSISNEAIPFGRTPAFSGSVSSSTLPRSTPPPSTHMSFRRHQSHESLMAQRSNQNSPRPYGTGTPKQFLKPIMSPVSPAMPNGTGGPGGLAGPGGLDWVKKSSGGRISPLRMKSPVPSERSPPSSSQSESAGETPVPSQGGKLSLPAIVPNPTGDPLLLRNKRSNSGSQVLSPTFVHRMKERRRSSQSSQASSSLLFQRGGLTSPRHRISDSTTTDEEVVIVSSRPSSRLRPSIAAASTTTTTSEDSTETEAESCDQIVPTHRPLPSSSSDDVFHDVAASKTKSRTSGKPNSARPHPSSSAKRSTPTKRSPFLSRVGKQSRNSSAKSSKSHSNPPKSASKTDRASDSLLSEYEQKLEMMQKVSEEERVQLKVKIELLEREKKMAEDRLREEQEQKLRELEEKNRLEKERLEEKDNLRQELAALKDEVSLYSQYHVDFCTVISNNLDLYFY